VIFSRDVSMGEDFKEHFHGGDGNPGHIFKGQSLKY
jgi:hypothetical protein